MQKIHQSQFGSHDNFIWRLRIKEVLFCYELILRFHDIEKNIFCLPFYYYSNLQRLELLEPKKKWSGLPKGTPNLVIFDNNTGKVLSFIKIQLNKTYRKKIYTSSWLLKNFHRSNKVCDQLFLGFVNIRLYNLQQLPDEYNNFFKKYLLNKNFFNENKGKLYEYDSFLKQIWEENHDCWEIIVNEYYKRIKEGGLINQDIIIG